VSSVAAHPATQKTYPCRDGPRGDIPLTKHWARFMTIMTG